MRIGRGNQFSHERDPLMLRFKIAASALVLAAALAPAGSAQSFNSSSLDVRNFIGRIEIREANGPILVNVEGGASDIDAP